MKKSFFTFSLIGLAVASIFLTVSFLFPIGEKYFFDKLIYKKSTAHGYYPPYKSSESFFRTDNPESKNPKHRDIIALFSSNNNQVLGTVSDAVNNYQIAIFGDSMSYGLGVRVNQSYPVLLENYLNDLKIANVDFTVFNYSMNGDDILDHYIKYREVKRRGGANLNILAISSNDFFIKRDDKYPGKNEVYDQLAELCGGIPIEEPTEWGKGKTLNQALLDASKNSINNCFFSLILDWVNSENTVAFAIEDISTKENRFEGWIVAINTYTNHLLDKGIEIWRFPFLYLGVDYEKTKLSTLENHPNSTTHKAYAYYLAMSFINKNLGIQMNDECRSDSLKILKKLFLQEVSKLK